MFKHFFILSIILLGQIHLSAQINAPSDKAVVYIARPLKVGFLVDFTIFDGEKVIGKIQAGQYIRYECEPGEHIFWAQAGNKAFLQANVDAGKIYIIEAVPQIGQLITHVALMSVDPRIDRTRHFLRLIYTKASQTFTQEELDDITRLKEHIIKKGVAQYEKKRKRKRGIYHRLTSDMAFEEEDLIIKKKKRKKKK